MRVSMEKTITQNVSEVSQFEHLFKMMAAGRFDLFCRGTNEVNQEYDIGITF